MHLGDRRWRWVAAVVVVAGTLLTFLDTLGNVAVGLLGVVLIGTGIGLLVASQRAAGSGEPPAF